MGMGDGRWVSHSGDKDRKQRFPACLPRADLYICPNLFFSDSPGNVAESEIQKVVNKGQLLLYSHHPPQ